jgi:glycosyl transferase family 11
MVVNLQGGLGNQMFQYAYGRTESLKRGEKLKFNLSMLEQGLPRRRYELGAYFEYLECTEEPGEVGYWQSEKYFDPDIIKAEFARPLGSAHFTVIREMQRIFVEPTCFVGVRRGDYLWPERQAFHGLMPVEYYREAMEKFKDVRFICFTDDPEWCHQNLPIDIIISTGTAWDIYLMSLCSHAIIANSTFHWWGAYLGREKQVIAPKNWFIANVPGADDIVPERWTKL